MEAPLLCLISNESNHRETRVYLLESSLCGQRGSLVSEKTWWKRKWLETAPPQSKVARREERYLCATAVGGRTGILPISDKETGIHGLKWFHETSMTKEVCIRSRQLFLEVGFNTSKCVWILWDSIEILIISPNRTSPSLSKTTYYDGTLHWHAKFDHENRATKVPIF